MKRFFPVFLTLMLAVLFVLCLLVVYFAGWLKVAPDSILAGIMQDGQPEVVLELSKLTEMEFLEESYHISEGSELILRMRTQPELYSDVITYSSSDATVARVDKFGRVVACGKGKTVITASCGELSSTVTVHVVDDLVARAEQCVRKLADGVDDSALADARLLVEQLGRSSSEGSDDMSNLISNVIAYADGGGSRDMLEAAIKAAGMDATACRTAAAVCWAMNEQTAADAVLSFAGDCTLARFNESGGQGRFPSVYAASGSVSYPFDRVKGIFARDTLTAINFEGTLTDSTSFRQKNFYFRGDPEYARILPASGVEAANLANNHSYDYYQTGFDDTIRHLGDAGIAAFYWDQPLITEIGKEGGRLVMLAANSGGEEYTARLHADILAAVGEYKNADTAVVVNLHWGAEGVNTPQLWEQNAAREMIDAGADLIIGHHSHVMQGIEMYNGKYIAYSLGNFSFGGNGAAGSPESMILRASLGRETGGYTVTGISALMCKITSTGTLVNNYQPMLCFGDEGDGVARTLIARSGAINGGIGDISRPDI